MDEKSYQKKNIQYFFIGFLIVFFFSFSLFFVFEFQSSKDELEEIKKSETELISFEDRLMKEKFQKVVGDLYYLKNIYKDELLAKENLTEISKNWLEFSKQRRNYDQIRFIDKKGDERIRVNKEKGLYNIVKGANLQNKKDRYYFTETKKLNNEMIFISPFDLNIENNEIETPYKPMVRFSLPINNEENEFQGMIILNYLGENVIKDFKNLAKNSKGEVSLVNSDGYWLSSNQSKNDFSFMFKDQKNNSFSNKYPKEWEKIQGNQQQFITDQGLVTAESIDLEDPLKTHNSIFAKNSSWYTISIVDQKNLPGISLSRNPLLAIQRVILNNKLAFLMVSLISLLAGLLAYLNKKRYQEIKYFSEYDLLTNAFNRRAGYRRLEKLTHKKGKRESIFSLCFMDVNGLKEVNDQLGHEYGDQLLVTASKLVRENIRQKDFLFRQGGDEFVIIFKDLKEKEAESIWKRILSEFEEVNHSKRFPFTISVSHGIVEYNKDFKDDLNTLIKKADTKMYEEKKVMKKDFNALR